jgi:hypothetical protein
MSMERHGNMMASIGEMIAEKNIILRGADALSQRGFTMVPNHVLDNARISVGAKLTYAMLLKYAWQNNFRLPGQEKLAKDMGGGVRSVVRYIQELEGAGFVKVIRRGLGKPNLYELNLRVRKRRV